VSPVFAPGERTADVHHAERGSALTLVLTFLLLGTALVVPLLSLVAASLTAERIDSKKTQELYAADAGLQDAVWQIKGDRLDTLFASPPYSKFDYDSVWSYDLSRQVNARDVSVEISNIWIPSNVPVPSQAQAEDIINSEKLLVTSSASGDSCSVGITYFPEPGSTLYIETIGVWLPRGFSYVAGSATLEQDPGQEYYAIPSLQPYAGNEALVWTFNSVPLTSFPGVGGEDSPMVTQFSFRFTSAQPGALPAPVAWITTSGVNDVPYSWDADTSIYQVVSRAGNTEVEGYVSRLDPRRLSSAIGGDYEAFGNSLMIDTNHDWNGIRDLLLNSSEAQTNAIPDDAVVSVARLYWSAWRSEASKQTVFSDTCADFGAWISGAVWNINSGRFRSHYSSGADSARYLTLKNAVALTAYPAASIAVSWDQYEGGTLESDDGLDFSFSGDDGATWSAGIQAFRNDIGGTAIRYTCPVPAQYVTSQFKLRFKLISFSGDSEYCYVDNIAISAMSPDDQVVFTIDGQQVYFDAEGEPAEGGQALVADRCQVLPNYDSSNDPMGFSYSAMVDVTDLIKTYSAKAPDPATNHPGNGTYSVGGVAGSTGAEWSYAGWSLIIVYTSADTYGHHLFLYDDFCFAGHDTNIDFDGDGEDGGFLTGFIVPDPILGEVKAAGLTVFIGEGDQCYSGDSIRFNGGVLSNSVSPWNNVWNGTSPGLSADGVDIDTFDITWASGLLAAGDTEAQIDLPTFIDNWNLVYIIISFRSEATSGKSLSYLIRNVP